MQTLREREKHTDRNCTKRKRIDLFCESLLVRANNLTAPPSHAAEALANRKKEMLAPEPQHRNQHAELFLPFGLMNMQANNLCCLMPGLFTFSKHQGAPWGVIVILTRWDKRLNENVENVPGGDSPCLVLRLINVIKRLVSSQPRSQSYRLLRWSNFIWVNSRDITIITGGFLSSTTRSQWSTICMTTPTPPPQIHISHSFTLCFTLEDNW